MFRMDGPPTIHVSPGKIVGSFAAILGVGVGVYLLFGPIGRYGAVSPDGTRSSGTTSGIDYLFGVRSADPALFYWSLVIIGLSLVGGYGAWARKRVVVWAVALPFVGLALLSMAIGLLIAPTAVQFLGASILLSLAHRAEPTS